MMFLLVCLLLFTLDAAVPEASAADTVSVSVGGTRNIPLGATITSGSLTSGTWSSSNSNIAEIISQSPAQCTVRGVSKGTATIRCNYKYYTGGTYITSSWSCTVVVGETGGSSGGGSGYVTMTCDHSSVTLDITKPNTGVTLTFKTNGSGSTPIYLSIDVRDGWPQNVSYKYDLLSENGSPVRVYCTYPTSQRQKMTAPWILYPKKLGSELITFQLVTERGGRYYNTAYQEVTIPVTVTCSHVYDDGLVIQEAADQQNEIRKYTCQYCGEVTTVEFTEPGIMVDENNFPDANFRAYIRKNVDKNGFGRLSPADVEAVTEISCYSKSIASLKGIEYFTSLIKLSCSNNQLTSLDVSNNPALKELICSGNQLTSLNLGDKPALETLNCCSNQLIALDVSGCPGILNLLNNGSRSTTTSTTYQYITYQDRSNISKYIKYDGRVSIITSGFEPDFVLPAGLTQIGEEAFSGGAFTCVVVPANVGEISSRAFADCPQLRMIEIKNPNAVIARTAFSGVSGLTIIAPPGSTAETFARARGFGFLPAA